MSKVEDDSETGKSTTSIKEDNLEATKNIMSFKATILGDTKIWTLATYKVALAVAHVTIIMILVALGDYAAIAIISFAFGSPSSQPPLAQEIFSVLKVLSILGTTLLYIIYLTYSLIGETKRVSKMIKAEQ